MRSFSWLLIVPNLLSKFACAQSTVSSVDVNVANVPDCAKVCLSNSTQYATDCAQIDVKCLCNSSQYVSALSCCLATNCNAADQQTAIQFNIQECAAVNSTAPNFVGCSPFSLTTGGASKQSTTSTTSSTSIDATTISGDAGTTPIAYTNTGIVTAAFAGSSLLTGTCSAPMFAEVTDSVQSVMQFPQIGCAENRGSCCPFDPNEYAALTKCPADYTTTAGGCCPRGYSVYNSAVGVETPCFSKPTKAYLQATPVTDTAVIVVTDTVFARKYILVTPNSSVLSGGVIAGIVVGAFACALGIPGLIVMLLRRQRKKQEASTVQTEKSNLAFPSVHPALGSHQRVNDGLPTETLQSPQELASPERGMNSPATMKGLPYNSPSTISGPPAYEKPASSTSSIPAEMPGSTHMNEHHPAFSRSQSDLSSRYPPGSPSSIVGTRSPVLSPATPYRTDSPSNIGTITPLGSPALRASPRFKEGL